MRWDWKFQIPVIQYYLSLWGICWSCSKEIFSCKAKILLFIFLREERGKWGLDPSPMGHVPQRKNWCWYQLGPKTFGFPTWYFSDKINLSLMLMVAKSRKRNMKVQIYVEIWKIAEEPANHQMKFSLKKTISQANYSSRIACRYTRNIASWTKGMRIYTRQHKCNCHKWKHYRQRKY